ncbi:MAG: glycosyltransferase [archaeon]
MIIHVTDIIFWFIYIISLYTTIFIIITLIEHKKTAPKKQQISPLPRVSVIVPAHNEEQTIRGTITSLLSLDYPRKLLDIIIVNDGSTDNTRKIIEQFKNSQITIINQENQGKGAALNNGLKTAKGELVACLDADSFVEKDTLRLMLPHFIDPEISAVCPMMKVKNPKNLIEKSQWLEYLLYAFIKMIMAQIHCINVTPGPFTIYRKKAITDIGGFDEKSIVEDQEIAYRLQKAHRRIAQSTQGNVYTVSPKTLKELYIQRKRWYKGTLITFYQYRHMLFNKRYGDFGMFQLPALAAGMLTLPLVVLLFLNYTIIPFTKDLYHLYLIGFDIMPYLTLQRFNLGLFLTTRWLSTDFAKLFIVISLFIISVALMIKAHKETYEKLGVKDIIPVIFFFMIYYIILSFMWVGSMIELARGKKSKWS